MRMSETISKISADLVKVMAEVKDVTKNSEGFGYKYASLDEVLKVVRPIAAQHSISIFQSQKIEDGIVKVETMLLHSSGEYLISEVEAPYTELKGMNAYQSLGAAITYLRRYSLSNAFGISSEEDTDASNKYPEPQKSQKQTQKPQPQKQSDEADEKSLEALGIELIEKDGYVKAVEKVKGAIYQNREVLKKLGFKFSKEKKVWYKKLTEAV